MKQERKCSELIVIALKQKLSFFPPPVYLLQAGEHGTKKKWGIGHAFLYCQVTPAVQKSTDYMVVFKFSKKFLA